MDRKRFMLKAHAIILPAAEKEWLRSVLEQALAG
jgi:hypothetical protein